MAFATPDDLKAIERLIGNLSEAKRDALAAIPEVRAELDKPFRPLPGPQTVAYLSPADQLLYGGQAGGGKSMLLLGAAANEHARALILRRESVELDGLIDDSRRLLAGTATYNGQNLEWTLPGARPDRVRRGGGVSGRPGCLAARLAAIAGGATLPADPRLQPAALGRGRMGDPLVRPVAGRRLSRAGRAG